MATCKQDVLVLKNILSLLKITVLSYLILFEKHSRQQARKKFKNSNIQNDLLTYAAESRRTRKNRKQDHISRNKVPEENSKKKNEYGQRKKVIQEKIQARALVEAIDRT